MDLHIGLCIISGDCDPQSAQNLPHQDALAKANGLPHSAARATQKIAMSPSVSHPLFQRGKRWFL
jgi:hypothetical protein